MEGLMRAVQAAPKDDGPRLAYADWYARQGEALKQRFGPQLREWRFSITRP